MTWKCSASRDLPIDTERAWDGGAAKASIFEWAGFDGDSPSGSRAARGFLAWDSGANDPPLKGDFKLPFAQVIGGTLTALASGVRAAASRLEQTDGLSDACKRSARDVLDGYLARIHGDGEEDGGDSAAAGRSRVLMSRMPIDFHERKPRVVKPGDPLPDELVALCPDPDVLRERGVFTFSAVASTNQVDSYGTRMRPSSLRNFANDAKAGLSLQDSHKIEQAPWGRSYDGRHVGAGGNGQARAEFDLYIIRGLNLTGVNHNDVIDGIRGGSPNDVSVGFYGGQVMCSLCGKEMMTDLFSLLFFGFGDGGDESNDPDAPCWHLPGLEYDAQDSGKRALAVGDIDGAHCAELSLVFDGATPGAHVVGSRSMPAMAEVNGVRCVALAKAERMAHLGVLSRRAAQSLSTRYRNVRSAAIHDLLVVRYPGVTLHGGARFGHEPEHVAAAIAAQAAADHSPDPATQQPPPPPAAEDAADPTPAPEEARDMTQPAQPPQQPAAAPAPVAAPPGPTDSPAAAPGPPAPGTPGVHVEAAPVPSAVPAVDPGAVPAPAVPPPAVPAAPTAPAAAQPVPQQAAAPTTPAAAAQPAAPAVVSGPSAAQPLPGSDANPPASVPAEGSRAVDPLRSVRGVMVEAGLVPATWEGDVIDGLRQVGITMRNLRSWADVGVAARARLADQVREAGVRAMGAEVFTEAAFGQTLATAPYQQLEAMLESFERSARARFPGGRQTVEAAEPAAAAAAAPAAATPAVEPAPDSAYRARF